MLAYAARTGTKRNLAALRNAGWRLLVSAAGSLRTEGFPYALDNGAWSAFCQQRPFDETAFTKALTRLGTGADWVVLPDIVAGGQASLALSRAWMARCLEACSQVLLAVQDGLMPADVVPFLGARVGLFVGGSTAWKLATLPQWGRLATTMGCWLHVGRVNTVKRVYMCAAAGATSFDGSSVTRFAQTLRPLEYARRQLSLFGGTAYTTPTVLDGDTDCAGGQDVCRAGRPVAPTPGVYESLGLA